MTDVVSVLEGNGPVVDERFAAMLAADFGIPETDVKDALIGETQARAIGVCGWAEGEGKAPIKKGAALTGWAKKHKTGVYAKASGPRDGITKVVSRSERVTFSPAQILANLDRMGA